MQFSDDNSSWSAAEAYTAGKSWALSSGDGSKTVYVKFKDGAGNWSQVYSDTITLDTTMPIGEPIEFLPKTGQTKCYNTSGTEITCTGRGQDGDIQAARGRNTSMQDLTYPKVFPSDGYWTAKGGIHYV